MRGRHPNLPFLFLGIGLLAAASASFAQTYGLGDQVTVVGANAFRADGPVQTFSDGYVHAPETLRAPLSLPEGAEIFKLCLYGNVDSPGLTISASLVAWKLANGTGPGHVSIPGSDVVDLADGYSVTCTEPFSFTYHETMDIDGDLFAEHIYLDVLAGANGGGLGGVRVFWRRQVSNHFGGPTFNDVPASDSAFSFVEALAVSGITAGCGGGNYCPDAPLTRRQMAVFLSKALGLHWLETLTP